MPDINYSFTCNTDEKLSDEKFMGKYAAEVLVRYDLVGDDEFGVADDEDEWILNDGDEEMADGDWHDEDMADKCDVLTAHLSDTSLA